MPKLIIKRNSEWANKMRAFELYLNGRKISVIKDRQILSFDIPEGRYQLVAKIDWCGSRPIRFEVKEGEAKRIEIRGFIFSKYLLPLAMIVSLIYFGIYFKFQINNLYLAAILMIFFGYMIYFMTFGRNQYLRLIEH